MQYILFDGPEREALLPFTFTRPVAHIRCGIDRLIDKWEYALKKKCSIQAHQDLLGKYATDYGALNVFINPAFLPTQELVEAILALSEGELLHYEEKTVASVTKENYPLELRSAKKIITINDSLIHLDDKTAIFLKNDEVLRNDFTRITKGKKSQSIHSSNHVKCPENIFIEEGAVVEGASLNASTGRIYIGKHVEVMEGSLLRGSIALCAHAVVKMGAKIYGGTTIGPWSKVGGELSNVVVFGYSNKGHDGFLGNAVIGEWCNIGAATDASNLKNSYAKIRVWDYQKTTFAKTELQFCGLLMGDYSRCGIHTMFNTATVIGVCANIYGAGFPRTFLPSFSFGGAQGLKTNDFDKAMETNSAMMERRGKQLSDEDIAVLKQIFTFSAQWRRD